MRNWLGSENESKNSRARGETKPIRRRKRNHSSTGINPAVAIDPRIYTDPCGLPERLDHAQLKDALGFDVIGLLPVDAAPGSL